MYLGASIEQVETKGWTKCWSMSAKKYVKAAIVNLDSSLAKRDIWITTSHYPMPTNYYFSEDFINKFNIKEVQSYQELIDELRWAVKIWWVKILLKVALLSSHLALPWSGHLQALYQIFGYLRQFQKRILYFDPISLSISKDQFHKFDWEYFYRDAKEAITDDMPHPKRKLMSTHCFEDADNMAERFTRR